jgi:aldose 1-epimerase
MRAGELFEITSGNRRAVVTEQGATLFRVQWEGRDVLDFVEEDGYASHGCYGQHLMPWPGRVPKGRYEYEGEHYQLPITDHTKVAAIHGWTRWATWQVTEHGRDNITLGCRLLAMPAYPFPFEYELSYHWLDEGLEISAVARNVGRSSAPFGYGSHPYFTLGSPRIDDGILRVPASLYFPPSDGLVPTGPPVPVDGTEFDFREGKPVGGSVLDITLTGLARDQQGRAALSFSSADGSTCISLHYYDGLDYVQLFTGDTLPERRRQGLAIEPNTCPPNAFNNDLGLIRIAAGGSVRLRWTLSAG